MKFAMSLCVTSGQVRSLTKTPESEVILTQPSRATRRPGRESFTASMIGSTVVPSSTELLARKGEDGTEDETKLESSWTK